LAIFNLKNIGGFMGFGRAVATTYRGYSQFLGRAGRAEYWYFQLYVAIVTIIASTIALAIVIFGSLGTIFLGIEEGGSAAAGGATASLIFLVVVAGLYLVWALATLLPWIAGTVRRVRDAGFSGLFVLVVLIPVVGFILLFILTLFPSKEGRFLGQVSEQSSPPSQSLWG
jgi:uncharacterized membrane protein YhaH (DUF805 family)